MAENPSKYGFVRPLRPLPFDGEAWTREQQAIKRGQQAVAAARLAALVQQLNPIVQDVLKDYTHVHGYTGPIELTYDVASSSIGEWTAYWRAPGIGRVELLRESDQSFRLHSGRADLDAVLNRETGWAREHSPGITQATDDEHEL